MTLSQATSSEERPKTPEPAFDDNAHGHARDWIDTFVAGLSALSGILAPVLVPDAKTEEDVRADADLNAERTS